MATGIGPLFTPNMVAYMRDWVFRQMNTPIVVQRESVAPNDDDEVSYTTIASVLGWLFSKPTPTQVVDAGSVITVNTYRLYIPVGTDILPGDQVVIGDDIFRVTDTTGESTWKASLHVSLRKRE